MKHSGALTVWRRVGFHSCRSHLESTHKVAELIGGGAIRDPLNLRQGRPVQLLFERVLVDHVRRAVTTA